MLRSVLEFGIGEVGIDLLGRNRIIARKTGFVLPWCSRYANFEYIFPHEDPNFPDAESEICPI